MDLVRSCPFSEQLPPRKRPCLVFGIGNDVNGRNFSTTTTTTANHLASSSNETEIIRNNQNEIRTNVIMSQSSSSKQESKNNNNKQQQPVQSIFQDHGMLSPQPPQPKEVADVPIITTNDRLSKRNTTTTTSTTMKCESSTWDWWKKRQQRDPFPTPLTSTHKKQQEEQQHHQQQKQCYASSATSGSTRPSSSCTSSCFICQRAFLLRSRIYEGETVATSSSLPTTTTCSLICQSSTISSRDRQRQQQPQRENEIMPRNSLHKYFSSSSLSSRRYKECDEDMEMDMTSYHQNHTTELQRQIPIQQQPIERNVMPRNSLHKYFTPKQTSAPPPIRPITSSSSSKITTENMIHESITATMTNHQQEKKDKKKKKTKKTKQMTNHDNEDRLDDTMVNTYDCSICNSCQHYLCPSCTFFCRVCGESYCTFCCRDVDHVDSQAIKDAATSVTTFSRPRRGEENHLEEDTRHVCYDCVSQQYDDCHRWTTTTSSTSPSSSSATLVQASSSNQSSFGMHEEEDNTSRMSID